jgi:hypothetical protein
MCVVVRHELPPHQPAAHVQLLTTLTTHAAHLVALSASALAVCACGCPLPQRLVYAEPGSTIVLPALTTVRHGMFAISLICGLVDTLVELEAAVSEVACGRMKMCSAGVSNTSPPWWQQLLELTCCVHMAACLSSCARRAGVIVARGRQGVRCRVSCGNQRSCACLAAPRVHVLVCL